MIETRTTTRTTRRGDTIETTVFTITGTIESIEWIASPASFRLVVDGTTVEAAPAAVSNALPWDDAAGKPVELTAGMAFAGESRLELIDGQPVHETLGAYQIDMGSITIR